MLNAFFQSKSLRVKCMLMLMIVFNLWAVVDGKRARVNKKKKKSRDMTFAFMFVAVIFCLTFVPLIGYFLYNVWKDPITPTLIKNGGDLLKEKTMGFLSKRKGPDAEEKQD
mmetsp:Transcript_25754/g.51621  ORF Transcript_25754/g.51621 Transcript_25754/m.51621 type:complete len:111 (+) Transcript_25754:1-333(+)